MPEGVLCTVSNCSYWGEKNICVAPAIKIEIDAHSNKFKEEFAEEITTKSEHKDTAKKSAETCCLTFKPKG